MISRMAKFPRTRVGGRSLSRLIAGSNWVLGYSHTTAAKDALIKEQNRSRQRIADILEVFFRAGVDTVMGMINDAPWRDGIQEAEQRTGVPAIRVSTPHFPVTAQTPVTGFTGAEVDRILDQEAKFGAVFCLPHQCVTDAMVDRCSRSIRQMDGLCRKIRERGMLPGLSTHMPETPVYADETNLDVETYIQLYNSMGFLMQVEVDWVQQTIQNAKKPVMTIKPLAAGQLRPLQGLTFVWNTIRQQDMVTIGTMTPREAAEVIEISLATLEHRDAGVKLQETRSKSSVKCTG